MSKTVQEKYGVLLKPEVILLIGSLKMTTYVYNEHDENQVLTMRNKLKEKRKRRINFVLIVLFLIFLVIFYLEICLK